MSIILSQKHLHANGIKNSFKRFISPGCSPAARTVPEPNAAIMHAISSLMFKNHLWPFFLRRSCFIMHNRRWNMAAYTPSVTPNLGISLRKASIILGRLRAYAILRRNLIAHPLTKFLTNGPTLLARHSMAEFLSQHAWLYNFFSSSWYVRTFKSLAITLKLLDIYFKCVMLSELST